jgi:tetratricopeptide (TPR) repeat protein
MGEVRLIQGRILHDTGRTAEALGAVEKAAATYGALVQRYPEDLPSRQKLGHALIERGTAETFLHRMVDAERSFRAALAAFDGLVHDQPNAARYRFDTAVAHHSLAWCYKRMGRTPVALEEFRHALDVLNRLTQEHPSIPVYVGTRGMALSNLADALRELGRRDEALEILKQAQDVADRLARENPTAQHYQRGRAFAQIVTASLLKEMGHRAEATKAYEAALESYARLSQKNTSVIYNIACAHACLATLISAEPSLSPSRRAEAARHLDEAMSAFRQAVETGYRDPSLIRADHDLDPLRSRPDFQKLMQDLEFPGKPFAK